MHASIDNLTTARPRRLRLRGRRRVRNGLSLIELIVVLAVLIAVAGVAVVNYGPVASRAQDEATRAALRELRDVFVGNAAGPGYLSDVGRAYDNPDPNLSAAQRVAYRQEMRFLFAPPEFATEPAGIVVSDFDPVTRRGWRGPYLRDVARDGWGTPLVLQVPFEAFSPPDDDEARRHARLVSAGPNGVIDTPLTWYLPADRPTSDDLIVYLEVSE